MILSLEEWPVFSDLLDDFGVLRVSSHFFAFSYLSFM
ncbi:hypothetical protein ISN44_As05g029420 [Arabidopsis suecica]|uniref:Uncharacterized protein n=1 Tax=Arabidopsis suecica TaxID=45249 RepID=A0A8T2DK87_ARASU|nr:hypothetical protein ISN44_As05g029420 [Arabidopsis suecica]